MNPLTLLLVAAEHPGLPAQLERLRAAGALVAHARDGEQARLCLGTLLPDLLVAEAPPAELPRGVRGLAWNGEPDALPELLAPYLPALRARSGPQRLGELHVDEAEGMVSLPRQQVAVHMPVTELRLLLCLGRHGGRAVSRHQLIAEVWPPDAKPKPRSVDQVVRRLRQLLEPLGLADRLRSLRGLGYRLDLDAQS